MVTHEVWIEGAAAPLLLDLEDDELFQQFKRWVQKDNTFTATGWVGTVDNKNWAINFERVACLTTSSKNDRRAMGFSTS
jgi:hypothetical protein